MIDGGTGIATIFAGLFKDKENWRVLLGAVAIGAGSMLILSFFPPSFGLGELFLKSRPYMIMAVVIACALLLAIIIEERRNARAAYLKNNARMLERNQRLHKLTQDEKPILKEYIDQRVRSREFSLMNGTVAALVRNGILYRSAEDGLVHSWAFSIEQWAFEYLDQNRALLD